MALIRLENVTVRFGDVAALDDVNLVVRHGETMGVLGPSGCGKTTLLKTVAGLIKPAAGRLFFDDHDVTRFAPRERGVGMVFESYALYPHLDARDNIAFPLRVRRELDVDARVEATARRLDIDRQLLLAREPTKLAAGEQQQVALGRALVADPTILLLDEPLSHLDAHTRAATRAQLGRLMDEFDTTAIYVTHDQEEAVALADRVAIMRQGRIVQVGTPGELRQRPANVFVAQFVGTPSMNVLPAEIEEDRLWIEGATASVPLPLVKRPLHTGPILAGVRPEHFVVDSEGILPVSVVQVEPLLAQRAHLVHAELDGRRITVQVPAHVDVRPGVTLTLSVDARDIHLFDPHDEMRIT